MAPDRTRLPMLWSLLASVSLALLLGHHRLYSLFRLRVVTAVFLSGLLPTLLAGTSVA